ncbi:MAG: ABC transporter ATP-binding protein [Geminicoccaceae bacterium]|nr:ABC transporter ATP-binding protein [Geminicoccaceae bacterium]
MTDSAHQDALQADPADRPARRWLIGFVRPEATRIAVVLALALVSTSLALAQPLLTKLLIDGGILAGDMATVLVAAGGMVGVALLASTVGGLNRWRHVTVSAAILFRLREAVFRHLEKLSPGFYARWRPGDILARLDGDVAEIQRFAVDGLLAVVSATVGLVGALTLMLLLSWHLALVALVLLPLEIAFLRFMRPRVERTSRALRERGSDLSAFLVERLPAIKYIQSVAAEEREAGALGGLQEHYRRDLVRQQLTGYVTGAVPALMTTASTACVFILGGWLVIEGRLTLGTLVAFAGYLGRATGPVQTMLGLYVALQRARVSLVRVWALMEQRPAVRPPTEPVPLPGRAGGEVRFEGVSFGHDKRLVLQDIDLVIRAGEKVALTGLSGAGKSTLVDLLHRHGDPSAGRILLDGLDLRTLDLGALRRRIAIVAQDLVLFRGTLLDNLRYAQPDADDEAVRTAAERAALDAVAKRLPDGWASDIGTAGRTLSGGERQRIAIARALLQDPLVLVLDEATSAVDVATEVRIIDAIDRLFGRRTRIVISHRPATLENADRRFELVEGRLYERTGEAVLP